jgi:hypothetical protein
LPMFALQIRMVRSSPKDSIVLFRGGAGEMDCDCG